MFTRTIIAIISSAVALAYAEPGPPPPPSPPHPITSPTVTLPGACTRSVCVDYVNSCGLTYGGCYPACSGYTTPRFTDPGCPTTTSTTSKPSTSTACISFLCEDFINSCGLAYGGCFPACSGYTVPHFTDPGCPSTTTTRPTTSSPPITTSKPTTTCTSTICADYVNSCGQTYGGCYAACSGYTTPHFTDPGCPTTTSTSISIITLPTSSCGFLCQDYFDKCGNTYGPGCWTSCPGAKQPTFTTPSCSLTTATVTTTGPSIVTLPTASCGVKCQDYFDKCGNTYGPGCYTNCSGAKEPSYSTPSCSLTTAPPTTTTGPSIITLSTSSCGVKCQDYFDKCGNTYGPGCYTSCSGAKEPTYSTPSCSLTATSTVSTSVPVLTLSTPAECGNRC